MIPTKRREELQETMTATNHALQERSFCCDDVALAIFVKSPLMDYVDVEPNMNPVYVQTLSVGKT